MMMPEALEVLDAALTLLASTGDWAGALRWIEEQSLPLARLVRKRMPDRVRRRVGRLHLRQQEDCFRQGIMNTRGFLERVSTLPYVDFVSEAAEVELLAGKDF